ncbi:MAG TPA: hypothetical protein VFC37_03740 [Terracidiphilus sp.]|jgi:hypothetical protein|nr:hypothetical protein [Terracidiphilus sp.]
MKWTVWNVIRLFLVLAASIAMGIVVTLGIAWLMLWLGKVVKSWQGNMAWELFSTAIGAVLIALIFWDRIVTAFLLFKGYSAKQVLFGDAPDRLLRVEKKWEERSTNWGRFFGRE